MIVDTRRLFCRLLRTLDIAAVCDVGSMDGSDALLFRRILPGAAILALEPNPRNFALMTADERLRRAGIRMLPVAASDRRGEAPFYVVEHGTVREKPRRGMSSLYARADWARVTSAVQVTTARLDELLPGESLDAGPLALWIDTEGMAFEVIRGGEGVLARTRLIHVEVETQPFIGAAQKLFAEVARTLLDAGFVLLATDQRTDVLQFNALFINAECSRTKTADIVRQAHYEQMRRKVAGTIVRLLPMRLKRAFGSRFYQTRCQ